MSLLLLILITPCSYMEDLYSFSVLHLSSLKRNLPLILPPLTWLLLEGKFLSHWSQRQSSHWLQWNWIAPYCAQASDLIQIDANGEEGLTLSSTRLIWLACFSFFPSSVKGEKRKWFSNDFPLATKFITRSATPHIKYLCTVWIFSQSTTSCKWNWIMNLSLGACLWLILKEKKKPGKGVRLTNLTGYSREQNDCCVVSEQLMLRNQVKQHWKKERVKQKPFMSDFIGHPPHAMHFFCESLS